MRNVDRALHFELRMGLLPIALTLIATLPADPTLGVEKTLASEASQMSPKLRERITEVIVEEAGRHDVDPTLILAVIATESRFRPHAKSHAGAIGLMQILPSTARAFASRAGVRWRGEETLYDPIANIRIGTAYLAWLLGYFDGHTKNALAGYCYGPARVRRRLAASRAPHSEYSRRVDLALAEMSVYFEPPPVPEAALAVVDRTVTNEPWSDQLFAYYVGNLEAPPVRRSPSALVPSHIQ